MDLKVLHAHSPVLRMIVPPTLDGKLPLIGFNDKRPLVLHDFSVAGFVGLLSMLFPLYVFSLSLSLPFNHELNFIPGMWKRCTNLELLTNC